MRTLPFTAATAEGIHANITIELFASTLYVTTAPFDITIDGQTWKAGAAVNLTQITYMDDGTPIAADVRISPDGVIVRAGVAARGLFAGRPIKIEIFDLGNPSAGGFDMVPNAVVGSVSEDTNGAVVLGAQGPLALLLGPITEVHTTTCRARFGDDRCGIPLDVDLVTRGKPYFTLATGNAQLISDVWCRVFQSGSFHNLVYECTTAGTTDPTTQPTYPTSAGGTVTDGTAVFTARSARLVTAVGQALDFFNIQLTATPSPQPSTLGNIIPQDGPLAGLKIPIRAWDSGTNIVTTFEPFAPSNFPVGTNFLIHPGCDKLMATCRDVFANLPNMRGTPYAPGADLTTSRA